MNKGIWKNIQPHAIAIGIFLLISIVYCLPAIQGLVVNQSDVIGWKGMAQSSIEFKEKYGHFPLWTNSLFGGMPAYQIAMESTYNITVANLNILFNGFLPTPAGLFFLNCIGMYILCVVLGLRNWTCIFGSIAYAFASYSPILAEVGHTTKLAAMGYMPAIIGGFILLTQKRYVLGFVLTMLFTTLQLYQNHIQITYYTVLILIVVAIFFTIKTIKEKDFKHLLLVGLLSCVSGGIGGISFSVILLPLNEYAKETMRGGRSELTSTDTNEGKTQGGLDKDYAFSWSYGIDESLTFLIPNARGSSSSANDLGESPKVVESMQDIGLPQNAIEYFISYLAPYWGNQPSTSGPVYFGIIIILLSIAGIFIIRNWHLGWIVTAGIIGIVMAWGSNLSAINYFLFDYLPYYSKFRAPSMSLVITQLCLSVFAAMALEKILYSDLDATILFKKLKPAAIIAGILIVFMVGGSLLGEFKGKRDKEIQGVISQSLAQGYSQGQQPTAEIVQKAGADASTIVNSLVKDRKRMYDSDLLRSLIFLVIGLGLIVASIRKTLKPLPLAVIFCVVLLIDLLGIDSRYLNKSKYVSEDVLLGNAFTPNAADIEIMKDTGYYRVFDQTENFTNESRSAYFHNSIGGYHPAKLALYQDLIQHQIAKNNMQVLNMLNTKYVIISNPQTRQPMALPNPDVIGPVWFVRALKTVQNADEEMRALDQFNPRDTAIIDKREVSKITVKPGFDSSASIKLIENRNDYILYESKSTIDQVAVFSEVYYPEGWLAFIDSKPAPIARVNYLLRALSVPAGNHKIEFKFEPKSVETGNTLSLVIGIISWIILLFGIVWDLRSAKKAPSA